MNILVIGDQLSLEEAKQKFGGTHTWYHRAMHFQLDEVFNQVDVVFDFMPSPDSINNYRLRKELPVFFNTTLITLKTIFGNNDVDQLMAFGFCGLPTFLNRELMEVSVRTESELPALALICKKLGTDFKQVSDSIGLVTPRIICMIINEAYCTVEEGTATRSDIDLAMKLGTNYPYGPFEWCNRIGIKNVVDLLKSVYLTTRDERYTICPLLLQEAAATR